MWGAGVRALISRVTAEVRAGSTTARAGETEAPALTAALYVLR